MRATILSNISRLATPSRWFLPLLAITLLASSCTKNDDNTTSHNDYCYIKSVTLGNIKRKVGTIETTVSGSYYEMTINLRSGIIENRDSLPYGCKTDRVTASIAFDGSTLVYREKGTDSGWTSYNETDSLDMTKPLEFLLLSNDNNTSRIYTLKVNVHQQEGDSLYWKQCESSTPELAGMTDMKAIAKDGKMLVLGRKDAGIVLAERSGLNEQGTWEETNITTLPLTTDIQTLREQAGTIYVSTSEGSIYSSSDAKTWQQTGTTQPAGLTLIEKTNDFFYAISEGKLLRSADAQTWEEELLDTDAAMLPQSGIRAMTVQQNNGNTRIIMLGQRDGSSNTIVWDKMWNDSEIEAEAEWTYFPISPDNTIPCPRLEQLNLLYYDGKCIALGGPSMNGSHKALDAIYVSRDYGITWRPNVELHLPTQLIGTEGCITSIVDDNNFIWIITNAQIWRGRLNKLGFAQQ